MYLRESSPALSDLEPPGGVRRLGAQLSTGYGGVLDRVPSLTEGVCRQFPIASALPCDQLSFGIIQLRAW